MKNTYLHIYIHTLDTRMHACIPTHAHKAGSIAQKPKNTHKHTGAASDLIQVVQVPHTVVIKRAEKGRHIVAAHGALLVLECPRGRNLRGAATLALAIANSYLLPIDVQSDSMRYMRWKC
jgi:hypothetical protein